MIALESPTLSAFTKNQTTMDQWIFTTRVASVSSGVSCNCGSRVRKYSATRWIFAALPVLLLFQCQVVLADNRQAPRFVQQHTVPSLVNEGQTKILQCNALGFPPPQYRWIKDGVFLGNFSSEHYYRIQSVTREDEGEYQCIAKNSVGSIFSEKAKVIVAYMSPLKDDGNQTLSVQQGEAAVFSLPPVDSYPNPAVSWYSEKEKQLYGIKFVTTLDNRLIILATDETDSGEYRAHITNTQLGKEETTATYFLKVKRIQNPEDNSPPQIIVAPNDTQVTKGTVSISLQCVANANPIYQLETIWKKDGSILSNDLPHSLNDLWNRTLTLLNIDTFHNGVYECEVRMKNANFPPVKVVANVTILEKPEFTVPPHPEMLAEHDHNVLLPCQVVGKPKPDVRWFHNTELIDIPSTNGHVVLQEDKSIMIKNVQSQDAGMYQCIASNAAGEASTYTWLKLKSAAPVMRIAPQNTTVYDGKDVQLPCGVDGSPRPNTTWILNDAELIASAGRIQILDSGALLIAAVQRSDAGKYTCIRSNLVGSVNATAILTVLVKTQIIQPPVDSKVILGHKATLLCRISHDETVPFELKWFFNKSPIKTKYEDRIQILPDGTLEIQEARNTDIGTYVCRVISPGGNDTRSARLDVIELPYAPTAVKAELLHNVPKAVNISWLPGFDGKSAIQKYIIQKRMMREEDPTPDPIIGWMTALTNVSSDQRSVVLTNLKPAMSYQFRVSAVNGVGEGNPSDSSNRVTLPQEPPSGPPVGVVGSPRSSTAIMVQWQPPLEEDRNGELRGYVIKYNIYGYPEEWKNRTITNEAQRSYIIDGLITWQLYEIKMAAYNDKGVGEFSEGIRVRTKEGVPLEEPGNVRVEAISSTSVNVSWKPPSPQMINGVNQGYKIEVWKADTKIKVKPYKIVTVPPSPVDQEAEQSALVDGLEKFENYLITVLCFTNPGDGKRSESNPVKTLQDVPDAVASFNFEDVKDRSVHVLWSPPKHINGILKSYTLKYFIKDHPENLVIKNLSETTTDLLVKDLKPSTQYTFEIFAWTEVGPGPFLISTIQSGVPPVLPHAPTKLSVSKFEAFAATLQFTPGFNGNTSITKYTVQALVGRNGTWVEIFETPPPDTPAILVENLTPHVEYKLRLIANNIVGASPPSEPSRAFQTLQAPPSHPPRSVTVRAMSAKALRVRWTPLQQIEWYGIPRGYNISYKKFRTEGPMQSSLLENHNANSFVIENLDEYCTYEVMIAAYNDVGSSEPSPKAIERTREAVPGSGPESVNATATSSTTIVVQWNEIPKDEQNGILEGYKIYYGAKNIPFKYKDIPSNSTFTTTLTKLKKYVQYSVQVLAYTRMGDGIPSDPPVLVRTFEDVPGPPSNVSFPDVSQTMARIIWDAPEEPNGEILEYQVTVTLNGSDKEALLNESMSPAARTLRATDLKSEHYYIFTITARTNIGWGKTAYAMVFTTNTRERPQAPSLPQISKSQIQSDQITFTWTPGRDGFAPLRHYTIQLADETEYWQTIPEKVDPGLTSYTIKNLQPFTMYKFRIQATNDIGPSDWSPETNFTRTLPGAPAIPLKDVNVLPITITAVKVTWKPLPPEAWNGDMNSGGYRIEYRQVVDFTSSNSPKEDIFDPSASEIILRDLDRDKNYEIVLSAFNAQGEGPKSKPQTVYVGEAVPTGEPEKVQAQATSPTEIFVRWKPPPENQQNGDLLGYKIFIVETSKPKEREEMEVVPATTNSYSIIDLKMYTQYSINVLAFNPAGDGPRSVTVQVRTKEGKPGQPTNLIFTEITMNSLRANWDPPNDPNGRIVGYLITYETTMPNNYSKQVIQRVNTTYLFATDLEESATYTFRVRAETIETGPELIGNITTGPQKGSADPPQGLTVNSAMSFIILKWKNGLSGSGPITGYIVEYRKKGETKWLRLMQINNGPMESWSIGYQNLMPSTTYNFRLFAVNSYGISSPAETNDLVTPSKLVQEMRRTPFYREVWFLVTLAAASIVIIILVIAVLCVKSKSYKYKQSDSKSEESCPVLRTNSQKEATKSGHDEKLSMDDGGFATFELRQSRRGTLRKNTLARKTAKIANGTVIAKPPPRPSPASVTYSDEEDLKGYDDNCDSSSLTEKPSEISSTETEATESDAESEKSDPHSFVNHYANVNDTLRQSWKRQRPAKAYSSYTDSDPEGSVAVSLNGGHIIMNNMAGSRAPLPGFSSFV